MLFPIAWVIRHCWKIPQQLCLDSGYSPESQIALTAGKSNWLPAIGAMSWLAKCMNLIGSKRPFDGSLATRPVNLQHMNLRGLVQAEVQVEAVL